MNSIIPSSGNPIPSAPISLDNFVQAASRAGKSEIIVVDNPENGVPTLRFAKFTFGQRVLSFLSNIPFSESFSFIRNHVAALSHQREKTIDHFIKALSERYDKPAIDLLTRIDKPLAWARVDLDKKTIDACMELAKPFLKAVNHLSDASAASEKRMEVAEPLLHTVHDRTVLFSVAEKIANGIKASSATLSDSLEKIEEKYIFLQDTLDDLDGHPISTEDKKSIASELEELLIANRNLQFYKQLLERSEVIDISGSAFKNQDLRQNEMRKNDLKQALEVFTDDGCIRKEYAKEIKVTSEMAKEMHENLKSLLAKHEAGADDELVFEVEDVGQLGGPGAQAARRELQQKQRTSSQ